PLCSFIAAWVEDGRLAKAIVIDVCTENCLSCAKHFGMRFKKTLWLIGTLSLAIAVPSPAQDKETVTIPKSRLAELQRAQGGLKKLRAEEAKPRKPVEPEIQKEQKEQPAPVTRRAPEPKVTRISP